jgi:hypothetical protein
MREEEVPMAVASNIKVLFIAGFGPYPSPGKTGS